MNKGLNEEWKKAILCRDWDKLSLLCGSNPNIQRNRVRDTKSTEFLYEFLFWNGISVEDFSFVMKICEEKPTQFIVDIASYCRNWDIVNYLISHGFRYKNTCELLSYLEHIRGSTHDETRRARLAFMMDYLDTDTGRGIQKITHAASLYRSAKLQQKNAIHAVAVLVHLKKQGILHKDIMMIIIKITLHPENVARKEWYFSSFKYPSKHKVHHSSGAKMVGLIFLFMVLCISGFFIAEKWIRG